MNPALEAVIDAAHHRRDLYATSELNQLPGLDALTETTVLGTYSYTLLNSKSRWIVRPLCIPLDGVIETPGAVARDYLKWKYKRSPRAKHLQIECLTANLRGLPGYAHPGRFDYGYYIDIRSTYWSIMNVAGWNVDYWPEKWLAAGVPPHDFPFQGAAGLEKKARNCLVSCATSDKVMLFRPQRPITPDNPGEQKTLNGIINFQLWRLVTDVLHAIGAEAIEAGAVYVHTDGYIAPSQKSRDRIISLIEDWGLSPRIDYEGPGEIFSRGTYAIGQRRPARETEFHHAYEAILKPRYSHWLQRSFSHFAAMTNREILLDSLLSTNDTQGIISAGTGVEQPR